MEREFAISAKAYAISAAVALTYIVKQKNDWESEDMQKFKKALGIAVGRIQIDILSEIYKKYPDLDDLADEGSFGK